jgi:hypothetical protein
MAVPLIMVGDLAFFSDLKMEQPERLLLIKESKAWNMIR